jgi:uncharacterized protein
MTEARMSDSDDTPPDSLLPYDEWTEEALRHVLVRALRHVSINGLPGGHHFYITFRTDHPGTDIPARLRAKYPEEMTIVLQHQFWDLTVNEVAGIFSVGLSFGGVGSTLTIPLQAVTAFADPYVRYGLQFHAANLEQTEPEEEPAESETPPEAGPEAEAAPQVVSLDAFRRRQPGKDS